MLVKSNAWSAKPIVEKENGTENKLWKTKKEKTELEAAKAAEAIAKDQTKEEEAK